MIGYLGVAQIELVSLREEPLGSIPLKNSQGNQFRSSESPSVGEIVQ